MRKTQKEAARLMKCQLLKCLITFKSEREFTTDCKARAIKAIESCIENAEKVNL